MSLELLVFVLMANLALSSILAPISRTIGVLLVSKVGEWEWRRVVAVAAAVFAAVFVVFETAEVVFVTAFWNAISARQTDLLTVFETAMIIVVAALVFTGIGIAIWLSFSAWVGRKAGKERVADGWHAWKIDSVEPAEGGLVRVVAENAEALVRFGIEFLSKDKKLKAGDAIVVYYADAPDSHTPVVDARREAGKGSIMDESSLDAMGKAKQVDLWAIKLTAVPHFERPDGTHKPKA